MNDHIVTAFSQELEQLFANILRMGGLVEAMTNDACEAIVIGDVENANRIRLRDTQVNQLDAENEKMITEIIALRQPLARDLRSVLSALKTSNELERIGDLAKNIAKRAKPVAKTNRPSLLKGISELNSAVIGQLSGVLDAYRNQDAEQAIRIWDQDDKIDKIYTAYCKDVLSEMKAHPDLISDGMHILFIAKNLERIGDLVTNIAEFIYFLVTGNYLTLTERLDID